jgi:hypothetical protein
MVAKLKPGCSGDAAKLPKNPGTQKLMPPWSAKADFGTDKKVATSKAAIERPAILRIARVMDAPKLTT